MKTELFHADGRTDREADRQDEANSRFSQFCEFAQNGLMLCNIERGSFVLDKLKAMEINVGAEC